MTYAVCADARLQFTNRTKDIQATHLQMMLRDVIVEISDRSQPHGRILEHFSRGEPPGGTGSQNERRRLYGVVTTLAAVHEPHTRQ